MEVHICNTDNQVIKLKKGEVGNSGSGIKLNIGLLQMPQPARVHNRKARVVKVRLRLVYHMSEGKQRVETVKWKPKKGLELLQKGPQEAIVYYRSKPSTAEPKKGIVKGCATVRQFKCTSQFIQVSGVTHYRKGGLLQKDETDPLQLKRQISVLHITYDTKSSLHI